MEEASQTPSAAAPVIDAGIGSLCIEVRRVPAHHLCNPEQEFAAHLAIVAEVARFRPRGQFIAQFDHELFERHESFNIGLSRRRG